MRRFKKPLIGLVLLFVAYTLVGFFVLPPILKSILTQKLSENLHREVNVEEIKVNPYILSVTVQGFKVKDRGSSETFAASDEIFLNLQILSALTRELILKEIRIHQPFLRLVRNADGSYNFSDLLEKKAPDNKGKGTAFLFPLTTFRFRMEVSIFWMKRLGKSTRFAN